MVTIHINRSDTTLMEIKDGKTTSCASAYPILTMTTIGSLVLRTLLVRQPVAQLVTPTSQQTAMVPRPICPPPITPTRPPRRPGLSRQMTTTKTSAEPPQGLDLLRRGFTMTLSATRITSLIRVAPAPVTPHIPPTPITTSATVNGG